MKLQKDTVRRINQCLADFSNAKGLKKFSTGHFLLGVAYALSGNNDKQAEVIKAALSAGGFYSHISEMNVSKTDGDVS